MFVVKRPFKNFGVTYTAGSVITEPASIKRFNGKLAEGKIVEVTEQTYDAMSSYFKDKFGVDIPKPGANIVKEVTTEQPKDESVESTETKKATSTPVKKVVAKTK